MFNRAATRKSYSSQGQDRFVLEVLRELRGGYFLDSGAGDGIEGSNTKLLEEEYGWSGICVEPNAELFVRLCRNRRCRCVNYCLYGKEGAFEFYEAAREYGGIIEAYCATSLAVAREAVCILGPRAGLPDITVKQARRPDTMLVEAGSPHVIDYWSLDTEGSELEILKSFPFDKYRVRVLTVEHNYFATREPIRHFLEGLGYERVCLLGIDDAYVLREDFPKSAWRRAGRRS